VKILPDEGLPLDFRHSFARHEAYTAEWAGLKGKKSGDLLRSAEAAGYEVLVTVDQGIPHQQSSVGRRISTIVLCSPLPNQSLEELAPPTEAIVQSMETIEPGQTKVVFQFQSCFWRPLVYAETPLPSHLRVRLDVYDR
jgi:hypothetical protein